MESTGTCAPGFEEVRSAFEAGLTGEGGAAAAAYVDGELVVDLWGGWADEASGRAWARDTLVHVYSVTKPFAAACLLVLVDRGAISLDTPVAACWPEFGQAGKSGTLVRHVLAHQTGLVLLREPQPAEALLDHRRMAGLLAAERPLWEPGTGIGEQALFFGHLVGELVRRVDGRTLGRFLAEEVAGPWGLDFHVGLPAGEQRRAAHVCDPDGSWRAALEADPRPLLLLALDNPPGALDPHVVNSARYRAAEIAAVNGHGTARAIARFFAGLAAGGALAGTRILREETVAEMLRPQAAGRDALLEEEVAWGLGLHADTGDGWFGMGGIGGFTGSGLRRPGRAAGLGYVTSRLGTHDRATACEEALERALAIY